MEYNEIYELVKPIQQRLCEHYPHDKYIKIDTFSASLCEEKVISVNLKETQLLKIGRTIEEQAEKLKKIYEENKND